MESRRLLQLRVESDFGVEQLGHGAAGFRGVHGFIEGFLGCARDFGSQRQMAFGDGEAAVLLFQVDGAGGIERLRLEAGSGELRGQSHGEATGVRGGEQLFGVRSRALLETAVERIRRVGKRPAGHGNKSVPGLQISLPFGACDAFHECVPFDDCLT